MEEEARPDDRGAAARDPDRFVLPPVERPPHATRLEKRLALMRMLEQAERERAEQD